MNNEVIKNNITFKDYVNLIKLAILKPNRGYQEINQINSFKNGFKCSCFTSLLISIISLITTILSTIIIRKFSWSSGKVETRIEFEYLKNIDYLEVIGKEFLIFLGLIFLIASIYYIVGLIFKKQPVYSKLIVISSIVLMPAILLNLVVSPLIGLLFKGLVFPINLIGVIYSFILLYEYMNEEIKPDNSIKCYFNLISLTSIILISYYLYTEIL